MVESPDWPVWIDAHCHLADPRYSEGVLEGIFQRSRSAHIHGWVQGGVSPDDWDRQLRLQALYGPGIVTSFGLHPWWVSQSTAYELESGLTALERRAADAQAIGELGLDFLPKFLNKDVLERQNLAFDSQLEIAKRLNKPLILHVVRSHADVIQRLQKKAPFKNGGIVHSFSGSWEIAREYLSLGFLVSVGGSITKNGFQSLKKAIACIPIEKLVVETDSPDQTPQLPGLQRDTLNEPANLIGIAKVLAEFCQVDYPEILSSSARNLNHLFGINL